MSQRPQILLADANVLIDFRDADLSVLSLVATHLGPLRVVHAVLEEVNDFDEARAVSLGMEVVDVPTELLLEVATLPHHLRRADRLCNLVCRDNDWICLTNDRHLRTLCDANSVRLRWGLELMIDLVDCGALSRDEAIPIAETMAANNPAIAKVLARFTASLS